MGLYRKMTKTSLIAYKGKINEIQICEAKTLKSGGLKLKRCSGMYPNVPTSSVYNYQGKFIGYSDTKVLKGRTNNPIQFFYMKSKKELPVKYE